MRYPSTLCGAAVLALSLPNGIAQSSHPQFEVVSVKPAPAGATTMRLGSSGGTFFAANMPLRELLASAYRPADGSPLLNNRILGAPSWIDTDRFDVEAKAADSAPGPIPQQKLQPMLRALLEDRFDLKVHHEMRELPVYHLTLAKGETKLKRSEDQTTPDPSNAASVSYDLSVAPPRGATVIIPNPASGAFVLRGSAISLTTLSKFLTLYAGRPVTDRTNVEGLFDVRLEFDPALAPDPARTPATSSAVTIFTALQEQLGLKLESARGPVEVLVIDSVSKPSEN